MNAPLMEMRAIGASDIKVSVIGLGTMTFGAEWLGGSPLDEQAARSLVDCALDLGIQFFDTADAYGYGESERMLGKILQGRRHRAILATKFGGQVRLGEPTNFGLSARHVREALDDSLRRLRTDYIDLYMPHFWDPGIPLEETLEALEIARRRGKIRLVGCSNFSAEQWSRGIEAARSRNWRRMEFDQVQYSIAVTGCGDDVAPLAERESLSAICWSPLGGGFLSGRYSSASRADGRRRDPGKAFPPLPEDRLQGLIAELKRVASAESMTPAQAALGWALGKPWIASAIVGSHTPKQLTELASLKRLSSGSASALERASAAAK